MAGGMLNIDNSWMGVGEYRIGMSTVDHPVPRSIPIKFLMEPIRDKREPDPKMPSHKIFLADSGRAEIGICWFKKGQSGQVFYSLELEIDGLNNIYLNAFKDKDVEDGWRLVDQRRDDVKAA